RCRAGSPRASPRCSPPSCARPARFSPHRGAVTRRRPPRRLPPSRWQSESFQPLRSLRSSTSRRPTSRRRGPSTSGWWVRAWGRRRWKSCSPELRRPRAGTARTRSTSGLSSIRVNARASARRSCASSPGARAATSCERLSTNSATSLSSPSSPSNPKRFHWAPLIGLIVSVALLVWVLHRIDLREVWAHAQHANPLLLLLTVLVATITFPVRTLRWQLILRDPHGRRLPFVPLWHATTIGFMANNLLPARAGEVARAYVASRQVPVRFSTAFVSIVVERVFDGLIMLALMAVAIAAPSFPAHAAVGGRSLATVATSLAVLFAALLLLALLVANKPALWL